MFDYKSSAEIETIPGDKSKQYLYKSKTAVVDMVLLIWHETASISVCIEYRTELFNEETILTEVEKVRTELIPEEELDKIKTQVKAGFINLLNSNNGMANQLASAQNRYGNWREMFKGLAKIEALTTEDIKRVAEKYLDPDKRIVVYLEKPADES